MFPHPITFFSFAFGLAQGFLLGSIIARYLGLEGPLSLLIIVPSLPLGIALAYYEAMLFCRLFGKK